MCVCVYVGACVCVQLLQSHSPDTMVREITGWVASGAAVKSSYCEIVYIYIYIYMCVYGMYVCACVRACILIFIYFLDLTDLTL